MKRLTHHGTLTGGALEVHLSRAFSCLDGSCGYRWLREKAMVMVLMVLIIFEISWKFVLCSLSARLGPCLARFLFVLRG
jgi:hypothetical protein